MKVVPDVVAIISSVMANEGFHELLFGVRRSIRYHSRRQAFFEGVDRCTDFILLLLGSGAVALALQDHKTFTLAAGFGVAGISGLKLVFSFGVKASRHAQFVKDFTRLEKQLHPGASDETVAAVAKERLDIEAAEPPVRRVLDVICHNELLVAMGYDAKTLQQEWVRLTWFQRLTANLFNWGEHRLVKAGQKPG